VPDKDRIDNEQSEEIEDESPDEVVLNADNFVAFAGSVWRTVKARLRAVILTFLITNLIINTIILVIAATADTEGVAGSILFYAGQFLLSAGVGGFVAAASGYVRVRAFQGQRVSMLQGFRGVGDVWGHIIGASLLTGMLAAMVFLFSPQIGFFLGLPLRLGPPVLLFVIAFEKIGAARGWSRTSELARGSLLRSYLYLLMLAMVALVILLAVQGALSIGIGALDTADLLATIVFTVISVFLYAILDTALSAGLLVTYVHCRAKEDEDFSIDDLEPGG
jgi:hypothetical protein